MKRMILFLLCLLLTGVLPAASALAAPAWPDGVSVEADGAVLIDADSGAVLYSKNADQSYYPASITKILTALVVLEHCSLDEIVTFSYDDVYNVEAGSSTAGIDEGDKLTVRDCLYAMMLASANESANALACHVSGSREAFAELMNETAARLGCTGSHFANPSGLNDENHYTTAHDMALIMQAAIKNPTFLEITGTISYQLAPTKRNPEGGYVACHHKMLNKYESLYYPGVFSGKTGYTSLAGNTLVTAARRDGLTLIAVILNGHLSHYSDTKNLLDFGFSGFQSLSAADYETTYRSLPNDMTIGGMTSRDAISLALDAAGRVTLPKGAAFSDLTPALSYELSAGAPSDAIACLNYSYDGHHAGSVYIRSAGYSADEAADSNTAADHAAGGTADGTVDTGAAAGGTAGTGTAADGTAGANAAAGGTAGADKPALRLPAYAPAAIAAAAAVLVIAAVVTALILRHRRKEQADLLERRRRRLERLEDIGYSSSDFDLLLSQRRQKPPRRRRGKKSIFR